MSTLNVPIIKNRPASVSFLSQLGIPHGSSDAYYLMKACRQLHTLNQAGIDIELEKGLRTLIERFIKAIAIKYNLECVFEAGPSGPPVRFAYRTKNGDTLKLIGANVWAW